MNEVPKIDIKKLSKSHWTKQEVGNAKLIIDFIQTLMNDHDFDKVMKRYADMPYKQHNRAIPDTIQGLVGYVKGNVKRFPDFSYDVKDMVVSGDRVVMHSHVTTKASHRGNEDKGFIIYDEWRVSNGEIFDHWDAIQPLDFQARLFTLLSGGSRKNTNSVF